MAGSKHLRTLLALLLLSGMFSAGRAEKILRWQDAVARLAQERTQAETCARALKKYGDAATIDQGSLSYGSAKSEYDGVIAGLIIALAQGQTPTSLQDLQSRLQSGFEKRETFCRQAEALVPKTQGQKGLIDEIVSAALKPLIESVAELWREHESKDVLTRKTIQTQLEATSWPAFTSVPSSP